MLPTSWPSTNNCAPGVQTRHMCPKKTYYWARRGALICAPEVGYSARAPGHAAYEVGYSVRATGHAPYEVGYRVRATGHAAYEVGYSVRATRHAAYEVGYSVKAIGRAAYATCHASQYHQSVGHSHIPATGTSNLAQMLLTGSARPWEGVV